MRVGRLRKMGRSFCCTRKCQKGRKWRESQSKGGNLLNTDLIGKARIQTGSSSKSFSDASNSTGTTNIFAVLDYKVHHEIDKLGSGLHFLTNGGPVYGLLLQKTAVSNYNGIAFSYAINNAIICFGYLNGKFSYNYFL